MAGRMFRSGAHSADQDVVTKATKWGSNQGWSRVDVRPMPLRENKFLPVVNSPFSVGQELFFFFPLVLFQAAAEMERMGLKGLGMAGWLLLEGNSESEPGKRSPPDLFHRWSKGEGDLLAQGTGHLPRVREVRLKEVVC